MNLNPRQRRLLEVVRQKVTMSVEELAQQLDVTPQTVRRDVKQMEEARLLARYHGGVGLPSSWKTSITASARYSTATPSGASPPPWRRKCRMAVRS